MNLVAKEFWDLPGRRGRRAAVLSEFAGPLAEMGEALQVNPLRHRVDGRRRTSSTDDCPKEERHLRMRAPDNESPHATCTSGHGPSSMRWAESLPTSDLKQVVLRSRE